MKTRVIILLLCGILLSVGADANRQANRQRMKQGIARLSFAVTEYDFGDVAEHGRKVSYDYVFENNGDCPLVITRAITSCKCVDVSYNKRPVPPGGQGMVTVTYNPKKQLGVFYKAIQVFSNAPEGVHIIIAKGIVKCNK